MTDETKPKVICMPLNIGPSTFSKGYSITLMFIFYLLSSHLRLALTICMRGNFNAFVVVC